MKSEKVLPFFIFSDLSSRLLSSFLFFSELGFGFLPNLSIGFCGRILWELKFCGHREVISSVVLM